MMGPGASLVSGRVSQMGRSLWEKTVGGLIPEESLEQCGMQGKGLISIVEREEEGGAYMHT